MKDNILLRRSKLNQELGKTKSKDLIGFVTEQFKSLVKKNLRVPIKLYQL